VFDTVNLRALANEQIRPRPKCHSHEFTRERINRSALDDFFKKGRKARVETVEFRLPAQISRRNVLMDLLPEHRKTRILVRTVDVATWESTEVKGTHGGEGFGCIVYRPSPPKSASRGG
jgi:hypothetical protein